MNFFEHQARARRQTRWLIVAFGVATILFVLAIDIVLLVAMGGLGDGRGQVASEDLFLPLAGTSVVVVGVILLASLYRTMTLRSGGAAVATELGGVRVDADTADPLRQRLRNVVEEMALASGVPVPDVYVLERESGINAFAAGYTTSDAAIAVTRGTLEKLNREQLQGVIAHEFSHILNGDMRLNIRMIGVLFGILVIAVIGRRMLVMRHRGFRSRNDGRGGIVMLALAITAIGYLGLFMARWIKASVSRRREFLADASAVQFTRNPDGIAGALKQIAVDSQHGLLAVDTEECNHMMFEQASVARLFASHPPLLERIRRIQPDFSEQDLEAFAQRMAQQRKAELAQTITPPPAESAATDFNATGWIGQIGNPDGQQLLWAALLSASLSPSIQHAAHSVEWAPEVLLALLLDRNQSLRDEQLLIVAQTLGHESEEQLRYIWQDLREIEPTQKLPLIEMTFPALKRRPLEDLRQLQGLIDALISIDDHIDVFEYAVAKMLGVMIDDLLDPPSASYQRTRKLKSLRSEAAALIVVLARHGHQDSAQIEAAIEKGLQALGLPNALDRAFPDDWRTVLDEALGPLDELRIQDKQRLIAALMVTASMDGKLVPEEAELMRVICAALHVPLPLTGHPDGGS